MTPRPRCSWLRIEESRLEDGLILVANISAIQISNKQLKFRRWQCGCQKMSDLNFWPSTVWSHSSKWIFVANFWNQFSYFLLENCSGENAFQFNISASGETSDSLFGYTYVSFGSPLFKWQLPSPHYNTRWIIRQAIDLWIPKKFAIYVVGNTVCHFINYNRCFILLLTASRTTLQWKNNIY